MNKNQANLRQRSGVFLPEPTSSWLMKTSNKINLTPKLTNFIWANETAESPHVVGGNGQSLF
jgi:hypothetical protein